MKSTRAWLGKVIGCGILLLTVPATITEAAPAKAKAGVVSLTAKNFSASGLNNEGALTALFLGDFEKISFNREELAFEEIFQQYLNAYFHHCSTHLPVNKVEMTRKRCTTEEVTRNGFGVEVSRGCVRWEDEPTGMYAKPELYAAKKEVERLMAADSLRQVWRLLQMSQKNPFAGAMSMASTAQAATDDMNALVQMNACAGPGLKRFEENLRLFALNKQPIRLGGDAGSSQVTASASGRVLSDKEYARLIEELVEDHARTWAVNRFVRGSVTGVSVSTRDVAGRPSQIAATYSYDGFNGRSQGSVTLHLAEGTPDCMYFFDAPAVCRTPNRRIVAAYAASARTEPATGVTPIPRPAVAAPTREATMVKPPAAPAEAPPATPTPSPPPPAPKRVLKAVNYIQGVKDACLEVLTGGDRREPEVSYCFCLSASVGSIPVSDVDAKWFFENFSDAARDELERRYPRLARQFASCRAQMEANSDPG